ncbi:hypothetical protein, partial [Photobacterium iliopiscarium]|uniref:hypothetical protein n=1 Tax=Photobacterium iliopiscarium TaxID=56192 RepID=UPI001E29F35C
SGEIGIHDGFKIRFLRECRFKSDLGHQISEKSLNRKIEAFFLPHHYSNFLKFAFHLVINQRKAGLSPPCYSFTDYLYLLIIFKTLTIVVVDKVFLMFYLIVF